MSQEELRATRLFLAAYVNTLIDVEDLFNDGHDSGFVTPGWRASLKRWGKNVGKSRKQAERCCLWQKLNARYGRRSGVPN
jgi:hypothetical protein